MNNNHAFYFFVLGAMAVRMSELKITTNISNTTTRSNFSGISSYSPDIESFVHAHSTNDTDIESDYINDTPLKIEGVALGNHTEVRAGGNMNNTVSNGELDAKLSLLEEKMDRRVERMESSISSFIEKLERSENTILTSNKDTYTEVKNLKFWIMGIAVSVVLSLAGLFIWSSTVSIDVSKIISGQNSDKIERLIKEQEITNDKIKSLNTVNSSKTNSTSDKKDSTNPQVKTNQ